MPDMISSLIVGDEHGYVNDYFMAVNEVCVAAQRFKEKFVSVYGEKSWIKFQEPPPDGYEIPDIRMLLPSDIGGMRGRALEWSPTTANRNTFRIAAAIKVRVINVDGKWGIDGDGMFADADSARAVTKGQLEIVKFLEKFARVIGHKTLTPEDIDYQMGKVLFEELLGIKVKHPDLFDVDKLGAE